MDGLSDQQLETVFMLCDVQGKGYMNASDLTTGLAQTLGTDACAAEHVTNVLGLGPNDTLNLREFINRVRMVYDDKQGQAVDSDEVQSYDLRSPASRSTSSMDRTLGEESRSSSDVFFSPSPRKSSELPRFIGSSHRGQRTNVGSAFSLDQIAPLDNRHAVRLSLSISDLNDKVGELKESMSESDEGFKVMLRKLFGTISKDIDKRFDNILSTIEEKWRTKNNDLDGNDHFKCRQEKLELQIEKLAQENSHLRERIDDLGQIILAKDNDLKNQVNETENLKSMLAISRETVQQLEEQKRQQTYGQRLLEERLEQMKNVCGHLQTVFHSWDDPPRPSRGSRLEQRSQSVDYPASTFHYFRPRCHDSSIEEDECLSNEILSALSNESKNPHETVMTATRFSLADKKEQMKVEDPVQRGLVR